MFNNEYERQRTKCGYCYQRLREMNLIWSKCHTMVALFATFGTDVVIKIFLSIHMFYYFVRVCFSNSIPVIVSYTSRNTFRRILLFDKSVFWFHNKTDMLYLTLQIWCPASKRIFFKSRATIFQDFQANYFLSMLRFPDGHMKHLMYTTFIIFMSCGGGAVLEVICTGNNDHRLIVKHKVSLLSYSVL